MADYEPGDVALFRVERWPTANEWPEDTSRVLMRLNEDGKYWCAVDGDPAAPFTVRAGSEYLRPLVVVDRRNLGPVGIDYPRTFRQIADHEASIGHTGAACILRNLADQIEAQEARPRPRCVAHGDEECGLCSRITTDYLTDEGGCRGCGTYVRDGLHWDTCPGRIRGDVYPNRAAAREGVQP